MPTIQVGGNQRVTAEKRPEGGYSSFAPPFLNTCSFLLFFLQGFEPRDTEIDRKLEVWKAMQALTGPKNLFSLSPDPEVNR